MSQRISNRMIKRILEATIAFGLVLTSTLSFAQKSTEHLVICRNSKAVRTLRVEKNKGPRCQTLYTKAGVDQNIGNSLSMNACLDFLNKVRLTLEKAQWNCKDIKGSAVSTLTETVN